MTGWIVASAATALSLALGAGTLTLQSYAQAPAWYGDIAIEDWASQAKQAVRVFAGAGSQIGVSIRDLNDEELKGGKTATGIVVEDVEADSPAMKAGFKTGDVIVEFDGERVRSARQFVRLVHETVSGRSVAVAVTRAGQRMPLNVEPRAGGSFKYFDGPGDFSFVMPKLAPPMALKREVFPGIENLLGSSGQLGIAVDELSPQLSEYFGTKEGVLVTTVRENSNASKAGVKAGDVITSLNGGTVTSAADLRRRAQQLEGGAEFTLAIVRDKKPMTLKGKVEPAQPRRSLLRTVV